MVNVTNVRKLIEAITPLPDLDVKDLNDVYGYEGPPVFCMLYFRFDCGAPACMMGWARSIMEADEGQKNPDICRWLGVSDYDFERIAYGRGAHVPIGDITREQAVAMLERLIETGEVDWEAVTRPEENPEPEGMTVEEALEHEELNPTTGPMPPVSN